MHFIRTQKPTFSIILIIACVSILFHSCQKQLTLDGLDQEPPNLTTKLSSSVSGFVTNENGVAVEGAVVSCSSSNTVTDKYGFFEIKNAQVVKEAAVVTVAMPGYFKGIKTYLATQSKSAFFRIKLLPKTNAGNIDAIAGGDVLLTNGLNISFPANAVVNAATNAAYTGQVNVAAHWIDPLGNELSLVMPGDLRGLDTSNALKLLTTYGMAAIELTGNGGELLQLGNGKKATITMPLPASLSATAPATIPLWYFDEAKGLWKEEGSAVKTGNSYVGSVSHFSYWNCDVPANYVRFNCTVVNGKGIPIQNALVKISVAANPQNVGFGYTDSTGYTSGAVPVNATLLLEVFGEYNCLTGMLTKSFTTTTKNISIGTITIPAAYSATVTGNVNDCNNAAVTNGYIIMKKDGLNFYKNLGKTGTFNFTTTLCNSTTLATFTAEDRTASQASNLVSSVLTSGDNAIGTLNACGISTLQFINYSVNGTNYQYTAPADSLYQYAKPQNTPPSIFVSAFSLLSNTTQQTTIFFIQTGIAVNSLQNLFSFTCPQINNLSTIGSPISIKITEYGAVGQFIAGNFNGTITGPSPVNTSYAVTCSFRVRRSQ